MPGQAAGVDKRLRFNGAYAVFALLAMLVLRSGWTQLQAVKTLPYSRFEQYLAEGKIESVEVGERLPEPDPARRQRRPVPPQSRRPPMRRGRSVWPARPP